MKSVIKAIILLFGLMLVATGCSAISGLLQGDSESSAVDMREPSSEVASADEQTSVVEAPVIRFTFYDSFATW